MNPVRIYDPDPKTNEYLSEMYFLPLEKYITEKGTSCVRVSEESLKTERNKTVLIHGDRLSPRLISDLKNNGHKIVVFDINDSSYFSSAYQSSPETQHIDLIFKVSGIPKTNYTLDASIDRNFGITSSEVRYLPDDEWAAFKSMKDEGRVKPLPYVLWAPVAGKDKPLKSFSERSGKVLVRGGNHFWRFVLFLRLMQEGLADENSMFATADYFTDTMVERFRYCGPCIEEKTAKGKCEYDTTHNHATCKSPATWGTAGEMFGGPAFGRNEFGYWNNRCPASFFWLAKEYERTRGPLDKAFLERALDGSMRPINEFLRDIEGAAYYGDAKWLLTIYLPPRFWEAAALGTVNYVTRRTEDQDHFPVVNNGEHYLTFPEDFSKLELPSEMVWNEISRNTKELYEKWIRGNQYAISTNLLKHIVDCIEEKT